MFALTAAPQVGAGTGLDRFAERLQRSVGRTAARGPLRGVTSALSGERWFGHPLHPALVVLPAGAWVVSAIYDARSARTADPADRKVADLTLKLGVVAAVPAALSGIAQFLRTDGEARRIAALHWGFNATAVTLYGSSWVLRARGARTAGRGTALAALGLLGPGAYLGGHLVYRLGVGRMAGGAR